MSDRVVPGPVQDGCGIREAVCIHTKKISDSCRDKDCLEQLRVYPTQTTQAVLERAVGVRNGRAELLYTAVATEPAAYNQGFYNVDIRYYYRVTAEAALGSARPVEVSGLVVFDKRVLLFGGDSGAKRFSSQESGEPCCISGQTSLPEAVVEAVDPIVLGLKLMEPCDGGPGFCPPAPPSGGCSGEGALLEIPPCVSACFDCELHFEHGCRSLYVTLGQFSIVRLQRDAQLLIPMYDYGMPTKECGGCEEEPEDDPCEIFRQIRFPVGEFFPTNPPTPRETEPTTPMNCP